MIKQIGLEVALIAVPVGLCAAAGGFLGPEAEAEAGAHAGGHVLPCGTAVRAGPLDGLSDAAKTAATDLQAKAVECRNADDDQHFDAFSDTAMALPGQ